MFVQWQKEKRDQLETLKAEKKGFDRMTIIDYLNGSSQFAAIVRNSFVYMRLYYPWNRYSMWKLRNAKPIPEHMVRSRKFFEANQSRIDHICNFLADEKSRDTFLKLVHMRQYYETNDIPQYNYFDQYFPRDIIHLGQDEVFIDGGHGRYAFKIQETLSEL